MMLMTTMFTYYANRCPTTDRQAADTEATDGRYDSAQPRRVWFEIIKILFWL